MRVLNPNYLWTCDPYTADHNYMLSKTFKMCDPVVDDRKLDALFCGTICTSPPGSPLYQASEVSSAENQDIFCPRDIDLKCILDDCNPAAKALAEVQVALQLEYGADVSSAADSELSPLPINEQNQFPSTVARFVEVLNAAPGAVREITGNDPCSVSPLLPAPATTPVRINPRSATAPISTEQRMPVAQSLQPTVTSTTTASTPYLLESKEQLPSSFVLTKNTPREHALQYGFTSSSSNDSTKDQTRAEPTYTPAADPAPVTVVQFLTENKGKRKRGPGEVIEPYEKKRRVQKKRAKVSPAVEDAVQPSSSTVNLPAQRRKRAGRPAKERPEVIDVDQEPQPSYTSQSTVIPQSNGLRQLLPASMRPSMQPLSPGNGFEMPPTHTPSSSSITQSPALDSQARVPQFNTDLRNNLAYSTPGVRYAENLGMPPRTFDQVSNYSAQYLERQRALLLCQQMQAQLQQGRSMNQTVGTSFVDPRLAPNGAAMSPMLAPTTTNTNNGTWSHYYLRGAGPSRTFQNSSLQSQVMPEPFDGFGTSWTPPIQATTSTHPSNWYQ